MSGISTSRRSDRARARRSERLKRWVAAPLAAAGLAVAGLIITASPVFRARTFEVTGNHRVPTARIIQEAGLDRSENVFWFRGRVAERLLERDPWVASATVTRELPSTISVRIEERRPASRVRVGSTWLLVASDGTVLGLTQRKPRLPALPATASLTLGRRDPALAVPARVAAGLDPWLRSRVASVLPLQRGQIVLELASGTRVLLGSPADLEPKERALAGIIRWAARTGKRFQYVDLRAPVAPAARPALGP